MDLFSVVFGIISGMGIASIIIGFALSICILRTQARNGRIIVEEHSDDCAVFNRTKCNCEDSHANDRCE